MALERSQSSLQGGQAGPGSAGFHSPRALEGISQDLNPRRNLCNSKNRGKALLRERLEAQRLLQTPARGFKQELGIAPEPREGEIGNFQFSSSFSFPGRGSRMWNRHFLVRPFLSYPKNPSPDRIPRDYFAWKTPEPHPNTGCRAGRAPSPTLFPLRVGNPALPQVKSQEIPPGGQRPGGTRGTGHPRAPAGRFDVKSQSGAGGPGQSRLAERAQGRGSEERGLGLPGEDPRGESGRFLINEQQGSG